MCIIRDVAVGAFMHARSSLLKHKHCNTRNSALSRTMPRVRQGNAPLRMIHRNSRITYRCIMTLCEVLQCPAWQCMCWWREKAKKSTIGRHQSRALLHMQHAKRYNTLWSNRSSAAAIAHVFACSILFNQYRNTQALPLDMLQFGFWMFQQKKPEYAKL